MEKVGNQLAHGKSVSERTPTEYEILTFKMQRQMAQSEGNAKGAASGKEGQDQKAPNQDESVDYVIPKIDKKVGANQAGSVDNIPEVQMNESIVGEQEQRMTQSLHQNQNDRMDIDENAGEDDKGNPQVEDLEDEKSDEDSHKIFMDRIRTEASNKQAKMSLKKFGSITKEQFIGP